MDEIFLKYSAEKLRQYESRIEDCLKRLPDEQIWARNSGSQNAIGNLVLHVCGNLGQWILSGVGGAVDTRDRDAEFAARDGLTGAELATRLRDRVEVAAKVIESLDVERLKDRVKIQKYELTLLEAIYHVVVHFAEHTGQVIFVTKLFSSDDLGFYKHLSQAAHGEKTP
jgi:uncharacterized damage-inducible protein DinB